MLIGRRKPNQAKHDFRPAGIKKGIIISFLR
jgi:hypothetical protein